MNTVQRIAKNTGVLLASQIISRLLAFFYIMYTARYLGAEGFGILSFALAFTGIFGVFTDLGLGPLTIREVARDKSLASKYLANISVMKVILVTITFGLIALVINLLGYPEQTIKVVYLIALSVIFGAFTGMFNSIFQAFERMEYVSLGQILKGVLMFGGVIFAIKQGFSVIGFASLYLIASVIVLGYSFFILRWKFANPVFATPNKLLEMDWEFWKQTIKRALPFALGSIFLMIYFGVDRVMLSLMKGDAAVGYYSAAYNLVNALSFIPSAFVMSIYPIMSNYFKTSDKSLNKVYQYSVKYMYMMALPVAVGTMLLSKRIIYIVYGNAFLPSSAQALNVLIWAEFFVFIDMIVGNMQLSVNKEKINTAIGGIGSLINVLLNLLLISKTSFIGAAIATVVTEFFYLLIGIYVLSKAKYRLNLNKLALRPAIATIAMGFFIYYFDKISLFILLPSAVMIYFGFLIVLEYISTEEKPLIKRILSTARKESIK